MLKIPESLEIIIVGNKRKEIITTEFLKDVPHRVFYTFDYDLPKDFKIKSEFLKYKSSSQFVLGAYRCFRGHQDAINSMEKDYALIFEDDAIVDNDSWIDVLDSAISLMDRFDIVSLHGRGFDYSKFDVVNKGIYKFYHKKSFVRENESWVLGALAYIVKKSTKEKIGREVYEGNPMDLYIANNFDFCFLDPSPFVHDRRKGSLIEQRKCI